MKLAALLLLAGCAVGGPRINRANATAHVDPSERDQVFSRALRVAQEKGWLIAVSDRAAGLLTSQSMNTGVRPCGSINCQSRSTLQVTIAETGDVVVNLHREFLVPGGGWFVPTLERDVRPTEAEQRELLASIVGARGAAPQQ